MADNYLEKRMEDYRAATRKAPRHAPRKTHAIFITDPLSPVGERALSTHLSDPQAHIAFAAPASTTARDLAQKNGARYYPLSPTLTLARAIDDARTHYSPLPLTIIETTTAP